MPLTNYLSNYLQTVDPKDPARAIMLKSKSSIPIVIAIQGECKRHQSHIEGILPKGPYLPCVSMAGRALLAGYPRYENNASCMLRH